MWILSLDREDPLEEGMATHSNILAWRIPWTEVPGGLHSVGLQSVGHNWSNLTGVHACLIVCSLMSPFCKFLSLFNRFIHIFSIIWLMITSVEFSLSGPPITSMICFFGFQFITSLCLWLVFLFWGFFFFPTRSFRHFILFSIISSSPFYQLKI